MDRENFLKRFEEEVFTHSMNQEETELANKAFDLFLTISDNKSNPVPPFRESLADFNCSKCGAGINFDALNEKIDNAPHYCTFCGQKIDWSPFFKKEEY